MHEQELIQKQLIDYFSNDPYFKELLPESIDSKTQMSQLGIFDSLSIINLITFIEKNYQISVEVSAISEANFQSIESMTLFMLSKK